MKPSLTVIMPALNDANNLEATVENVYRAFKISSITDFEIIVLVNARPDGSRDSTLNIANELAGKDSKIRVIDNGRYFDFGETYWQGVEKAEKDYLIWIPADNETVMTSIAKITGYLGKADIVIPYTSNPEVRALKRRIASKTFTKLCNFLFALDLKYYNGICIHKRTVILKFTPAMRVKDFSYMAAALIYLIKSGASYLQVPMEIRPTTASASFKLRSVFKALNTLASLFWNIHFKRIRIKLVD